VLQLISAQRHLIQSLRGAACFGQRPTAAIDDDFQLRANLLEARDPDLFGRKSDALLRISSSTPSI